MQARRLRRRRPPREPGRFGVEPEPWRVEVAPRGDVGAQRRALHPAPVADFGRIGGRIGSGGAVVNAGEDVDDLVFPQAVADRRLVGEQAGEDERRGDAHLLGEPPRRRPGRRLAGARMGAAGVAPQAGRMVLLRRAALEQHAAGAVEHQHRDGAVAQVLPVGGELAFRAERPVGVVDQDDPFLVRACALCRDHRAVLNGRGCRGGGGAARRGS